MLKKILTVIGVLVLLLIIAGWLLFGVFIYPGEEPQSGKTALVNGHFITMATEEPKVVDDKALLIEDGSISGFVAENKLPENVNRTDLNNGYAVPGLFDMHVHMIGTPGAEGYSFPFAQLERLRGYPNIRAKFLRYGITTITSLGDPHPQGINLRNKIALGRLSGPRMRVAGPELTAPGGHPVSTLLKGKDQLIRSLTRQLDSADSARIVVNQLVDEGVDLIKVINSAGTPVISIGPYPKIKYDVLEAIVDQAHLRGKKVVVHTETQSDVEDAVRAGVDGVEHMAFDVDEEVLKKIENQDMVVVPTLSAWQKYVQLFEVDNRFPKTVPEEFSKWLKYDIKFALGTDAAEVPVGESLYKEMQLFAQAGMNPYEILQAATINAAEHAEMASILGSLEPGKYADVVVFEKNPLKNIPNLQKPRMVFKKGKLIANK